MRFLHTIKRTCAVFCFLCLPLTAASVIWFDKDSLFTDAIAAIKSLCYMTIFWYYHRQRQAKNGLKATAGYHRSAIINNSRIVYRKEEELHYGYIRQR